MLVISMYFGAVPSQVATIALKVIMSSTLLFWPTMSEADAGGMTAKVEPSHQYSITFCCSAHNR